MAIEVITRYQEGDSPYIIIKHYTFDLATEVWTLANPDANFPKITIADKNGVVKVDAVTIAPTATGTFGYWYELPASPALGWWRGFIDVENSGYPDREHFGFEVK